MEHKVLQPYKDWLLLNRCEIRPEIGDKYIKFDVGSVSEILKDDNGNTHQIYIGGVVKSITTIGDRELQLHIRACNRNQVEYLKGKYVEIDYNPDEVINLTSILDSVTTLKNNNEYINKKYAELEVMYNNLKEKVNG